VLNQSSFLEKNGKMSARREMLGTFLGKKTQLPFL